MATRSWALAVTMLLLTFVMAGDDARSISGMVTDKRGNVLPGAIVQIDNSITKEVQSYIVQNDGHYLFRDLNPNVEFVLHAMYKGHVSKSWTFNRFNGTKNAKQDFVIPID